MSQQPQWPRILDIILGLITIVFGVLLFIVPPFNVVYGIGIVLGLGLIILGIWQIMKLLPAKDLGINTRIISLLTGLLMLIFGVLFVVSPSFFPTLIVFILPSALLIIGLFLLVQGTMGKIMKLWIRILYILFGIFAIGIAIPAFILPATWGLDLVSIAVSVSIIFFGTLRLLVGITGDNT